MPFSVATRWPFASRAVATSNWRAPSFVVSGPKRFTAIGSSVKVHSFTAPRTPCAAPIRATQICAPDISEPHAEEFGVSRAPESMKPRSSALLLGSGFGGGPALLARHRPFPIVARRPLGNPGGIEEAGHAIGRLRALGEPGLDLVHVELQPSLVIICQQRIEMAEPLDETAVAGKARVGNDHVIDRTLLGACAREADND